MNLTASQEQAIAARGNVLVVAGAGTGKTSTLVERCLSCLLDTDSPASLDEILMVTFTEAAAAELRQRIRLRLEQECAKDPSANRLREQLALFETAHIGTLHSFCLQVIRQHFYELELDPQVKILPAAEARVLAEETLGTLLEEQYACGQDLSSAVQDLIRVYGRGSDSPIRALVQRIHRYAEALPQPHDWFKSQLHLFTTPTPIHWQMLLTDAIEPWRKCWLDWLKPMARQNGIAANCIATMNQWDSSSGRKMISKALDEIVRASEKCPRGKKTEWLEPLNGLIAEARFLLSLAPAQSPSDPLAQDWEWCRFHMISLLKLSMKFGTKFAEAKREFGVLDFSDLEQFALRLLWNPESQQPTSIARYWRIRLRYIFVDEYQDINTAQDRIIEALSREGSSSNRFLVGDVKQSIYRFRLANPYLFQAYAQNWQGDAGQTITLTDNFRSREGILGFVNSFFSTVMEPGIGGTEYAESAYLRFGAAESRPMLDAKHTSGKCVEMQLRIRKRQSTANEEEASEDLLAELVDLDEADKEARSIALKLCSLKAQAYAIWDERKRAFRSVEWRDMAVLLRSPSKKAESYAKEFSRLAVPLLVGAGSFYESLEVQDLMSILRLLDNPFQDICLLAVLRSPLVGLSLDQLASLRLANKGPLWVTLQRWVHKKEAATPHLPDEDSARSRVRDFLERFARWRRLARQTSLTSCLETILTDTHYEAWLLTQTRGEQRQANLQRLINLTQQFDQLQKQGLFRFLCFVEAQRTLETEPTSAPYSEDNSVQLLSIHQSKGLEFPVVVVADLGKPFNETDLHADIILDEELGLCPQVKPPHAQKRYPSLPYWLAKRRQQGELLGEEMRLLYVAMTRAKDFLMLSGSISSSQHTRLWDVSRQPQPGWKQKVRSCFEWIGFWLRHTTPERPDQASSGENAFLRWRIVQDEELVGPSAHEQLASSENAVDFESPAWRILQIRLSSTYGHLEATQEPAKTSVTALRKRVAPQQEEELPYILELLPPSQREAGGTNTFTREKDSAAVEVGRAHHRFLQFVSIGRTHGEEELKKEARRLVLQGTLAPEESALLDFGALMSFWNSKLGAHIRQHSAHIHRELPFTASFPFPELCELTGRRLEGHMEQEFITVQGVADLVLVMPEKLWLLDFKTDRITAEECIGRARSYAPQITLYARALSRIYRREASVGWVYFLMCAQAVQVTQAGSPPLS